ncbi:MAG: stalk domain-containing protein [Dethiobacteria bacterium]
MKRYLLLLLIITMFLPVSLALAQENIEENKKIRVFINKEEVFFDVAPQVYRGNVMVPLYSFFENLGATVNSNEEDGTIIIKKDSNVIIYYPHISYVEINDSEKKFFAGTPSMIVKGTTMVPLHFFLNFWNFRIDWNEDSGVVEVESSDFVPFQRISAEELHALPGSIGSWVDNARNKFSLQAKREKEKLFILGAYGKKPSGGYEVEIKQITKGPEMLKVRVEFREPLPGQPAIQVISRPFELVYIDLNNRKELQDMIVKGIEPDVNIKGLKTGPPPVFLELS